MTIPGAPYQRRRTIYLWSAVVLVALAIWGLLAFRSATNSPPNDEGMYEKANELHSRLLDAGLPAPDARVIAGSLGADGADVCLDPGSPLIKARYQASISNGATGPGARPVIGDRDVAKAVGLAIATYCPDKLGAYLKQVGSLKLEDTAK